MALKSSPTSQQSQEKKSNLPDLYTVGKGALITSLAAQIFLAVGTPVHKNANKSNHSLTDARGNTIEMTTADQVELKRRNDRPSVDNIFIPGSIVFTKGSDSIVIDKDIVLPYEFAPQFTTGNPKNSTDYQQLKDSIYSQLTTSINDALVGFNFATKEVTTNNHNTSVNIHNVTGSASPESYQDGDYSLTPGVIEAQNTTLASDYRAHHGDIALHDALKEMIIDHPHLASRIDTSSVMISGVEQQLIESELTTLVNHQHRLGYPTVVDMIRDFNNNKLTDVAAHTDVQTLIDTKRNVTISFTIKGQPDNIYVIPLILPLYLFLLGWSWKKNKDSDHTPPPPPPPSPIPTGFKQNKYRYTGIQSSQVTGANRHYQRKQPRDNRAAYHKRSPGNHGRKHNRKGHK